MNELKVDNLSIDFSFCFALGFRTGFFGDVHVIFSLVLMQRSIAG